jgi:cobalt-zinc-cadmium efflux system protein
VHSHSHDHAHDHEHSPAHSHAHGHDHSHTLSADADRLYLTVALVLILGFMAFEVVIGIVAHSLALISDAGHMLTDAGALILSLLVIRLVQRPSGEGLTYGLRRAEVLSGQANGAVLLVLGVLVSYEAISRLIHPPQVSGMLVTVVAGIGIVVNIIAAWVLAKANRESLNVEGSFQHILTDLYAFIGTFIAGVVIIMTGFDRADAIASIAVAALMIRSGYVLQRKSIRVLLESAPEATTVSDVGWAMARTPQVSEVHDLHLWELTPGTPILTAHVLVAKGADCHAIRRSLEQLLREKYRIAHTTLQVDHAQEQLLSITRRQTRARPEASDPRAQEVRRWSRLKRPASALQGVHERARRHSQLSRGRPCFARRQLLGRARPDLERQRGRRPIHDEQDESLSELGVLAKLPQHPPWGHGGLHVAPRLRGRGVHGSSAV